jgi:oxaloacetate decarboxylase alpha subunit
VILFAKGFYGEDSGYTWIDQNLKDRLLSLRRAKELVAPRNPEIPLNKIREQLGGLTLSDEELLRRYIMKGTKDIEEMRAADQPREYCNGNAPLLDFLQKLGKNMGVRYIQVQRGANSLLIEKRSGAAWAATAPQ